MNCRIDYCSRVIVIGAGLLIMIVSGARGETFHCLQRQGVTLENMNLTTNAYGANNKILCYYSDQQAPEFERSSRCDLKPVTRSIGAFPNFSQMCKVKTGSVEDCTVTCEPDRTAGTKRRILPYDHKVVSISFSPDGTKILTGSDYDAVKLWDLATGRLVRTFEGQAESVWSVALSPDGREALVANQYSNALELWEVETGKLSRTLNDQTSSVSVAFSPDGLKLLSAGSDGTLTLWDRAKGKPIYRIKRGTNGATPIGFSPDGIKMASAVNGDVYIWSVDHPATVNILHGQGIVALSAAFSPDGLELASEGGGDTFVLWNVQAGKIIRTFEGSTDSVMSVALSPDGRAILSASADGTIRLWDRASGLLLHTFDAESAPAPAFSEGWRSVAFSPDGRTLAAVDMSGGVAFWTIDPSWFDAAIIAKLPAVTTIPTSVGPTQPSSPSGRRVALIIANGNYKDAPLGNPPVDAGLVAESLDKAGFAVTVKRDLGLDAFEQAVDEFAETSKGADLALFYFAGHGFSVAAGGLQQNLLMATSADFKAKTALGLMGGGEPLEHVEETLVGHAHATLIFIDACRNVPTLSGRGVGARGFARLDSDAADGAYVVLSTRQGKTAADGDSGQGSPFARAFASVLPTPGLRIEDAFARIRETVRKETGGEQIPDVVRSDLPEGGVTLTSSSTH